LWIFWNENGHHTFFLLCLDLEMNGIVALSFLFLIKRQPAKILRYFALKPRLQRLFRSFKIVEHIRWHAVERNNEGILRYPKDSYAWKQFDSPNSHFALNPRNIQFGLTTDGFNPFGNLSTSYSIWSVIFICYNLSLWMCMKHNSFILSMIIFGKWVSRNDIDIYLPHLIDELKELRNILVDAFVFYSNGVFNMRATILWKICDFLGFGPCLTRIHINLEEGTVEEDTCSFNWPLCILYTTMQ